MMATELDPYVIDQLDFEPACEFGEGKRGWIYNATLGSHDDPARWILYKRHECGMRFTFVCDRCKVTLYDQPEGMIACAHCHDVFPHRVFFSRIAPLSRS